VELSEEQRRRIELEEGTRIAEEIYRAEVRHEIMRKKLNPPRSIKGKLIGGALLIFLLAYAMSHC